MAHGSINSAFFYVFLFAGALLSPGVVRAQDSELAPSPSPLIEAGAGSFITVSCAIVCSSLLYSVLILLRH
ncbi:hypothetical protein CRYUN_Cryun11dG0075000 [Craigia yunnanensis]